MRSRSHHADEFYAHELEEIARELYRVCDWLHSLDKRPPMRFGEGSLLPSLRDKVVLEVDAGDLDWALGQLDTRVHKLLKHALVARP